MEETQVMQNNNVQKLRKFFKEMTIDEANIGIWSDEEQEMIGYEYEALNDNEFQFGRVGDMPTNYVDEK